jgi:hypothetical protein
MTHWSSIRSSSDAPIHYGNAEAAAWADGYNSAVEAYEQSVTELIKWQAEQMRLDKKDDDDQG